jgi:hypothetical protein
MASWTCNLQPVSAETMIMPNFFIRYASWIISWLSFALLVFNFWRGHVTKKERDQTTTRPLWLYCIACDWSSIEHSHINRACTTTFTDQTHLSLLQPQSLHRAPRMEFHNSGLHKKSPPTQTSKLLEHRTKVWHLSVYDHALLRKQTTQICWSPSLLPKLLCSTTSFLTRSDSSQTQELALS